MPTLDIVSLILCAQALSLYQEELARLQQSAALAAALRQEQQQEGRHQRPPVLPSPSEEDNSIEAIDSGQDVVVKSEEAAANKDIVAASGGGGKSLMPVGPPPAFFPTAMPNGGSGHNKAEDAGSSPLQRMASITNALVSQPPPVNFPGTSPRPLKHALPPITQQQFDRYSHVNTDDTVRRIKEILSQYSISQRLFGEAVLGLSQVGASVLSVLAVLHCM
jgi:hypothetical protein